MDIVVITWEDIESRVGWHDATAKNISPPVFRTVGYLVKKTKKKVVICDSEGASGNITVFPRGCVLNITTILED